MNEMKFKNHALSIVHDVFKVIVNTLVLVLVYFVDFFMESKISTKTVLYALLIFLGYVLIIVAICSFRWYKTHVLITDKSIIVECNTLFKKKVNINIKDISAIDIGQNMLDRAIKTARIQIDINSVATAYKNDAKIVLKYDDAVKVQNHILQLMGEEVAEENSSKIVLDDYDYSYKFEEIVRHSLFGINPVVALILLASFAGSLIPFFIDESDGSKFLLSALIIVVPFLYSGVMKFFKYYGFKLKKDKEKDKILVSYGLFSVKKYNLPYEKINGIKITQSIFARMFNMVSVEPINIGFSEENVTGILIPYVKKDKAFAILGELFDYDLDYDNIKQPKKSIMAFVLDDIIFIAISLIIAVLINVWAVLVVVVFWALNLLFAYKSKKIDVKNETLYITNGLVTKTTVICKTPKIQNVKLKTNAYAKRKNMSRIRIFLQASMLNVIHVSGYFDNETYKDIVDKL